MLGVEDNCRGIVCTATDTDASGESCVLQIRLERYLVPGGDNVAGQAERIIEVGHGMRLVAGTSVHIYVWSRHKA